MLTQADSYDAETARLAEVRALGVLDTIGNPRLDRLTRIACALFDAPTALISIVDRHRLWFASAAGFTECQRDREGSFCDHAIREDGLFEVVDATNDARFRESDLVTQEGGVRYYAGVPLVSQKGYAVGAFCIIDDKPRPPLTPEQAQLLADIGETAMGIMELGQRRLAGDILVSAARSSPDALICADADGRIVFWSPGARKLFGYPRRAMLGEPFERIVPERLRKAHQAGFQRYVRTGEGELIGKSIEITGLHRDGHEIEVELALGSWRDPSTRQIAGVGAILRDIGKRKELERQQTETRLMRDATINNLPLILFVKDAKTRQYLLFNAEGEAMTGLDAKDVIGKTDEDIGFPDAAYYAAQDDAALANKGPQNFKVVFERPMAKSGISARAASRFPTLAAHPSIFSASPRMLPSACARSKNRIFSPATIR